MYLGQAETERRAWTGTVQYVESWDQVRFSSVGFNTALHGTPAIIAGLKSVVGHCVRVEGTREPHGGIHVTGWAILPDGAEFTEGGVTYTCGAFRQKVAVPGQEPDPAPPVTSGGTVTTTGTLPPGTNPATAPVVPAGAAGGLASMALPLLAVGAVLLFARPGRD